MFMLRSILRSRAGGALAFALLVVSLSSTAASEGIDRRLDARAHLQEAAAEEGPNRGELRERIEGLVKRMLEQPGAVGLSVAVAIGDELVLAGGYGIAEAEHDVPANVDTMFRIGSVTKQFTSAAIMRLVEKDELALEDLLVEHVPKFPTRGHEVSILHLLTHTSGIKSYTGLGDEWQKIIALELSHEELLDLVRDAPFDFAPGERFLYNNTAYYLLGVIVERITGQSYADHLRTEILQPLGLTRTRYGSNTDLIKNRAQGYQMIDDELANDALIGMSQPGAAGALLSTAKELVQWQLALVGGKVVSPDSYELMTTPFMLNDSSETKYGFGLAIGTFAGQPVVQHGGGINGFNSILSYYPEAKLSVAVISNSEACSAGQLGAAIARAVLE